MKSRYLRSRLAAAVAAVFLAAAVLPAAALDSFAPEDNASDVVVLLDVSQSVLPYFHDITDYVVSSVVKDFLRTGDTFHLLSFGETTQVEIAQRVGDESDVRSILARLYLLYPLARNTEILSALDYLYQYLADLPENRSKVVVVITDGLENPSKGDPSFGLSPEDYARGLDQVSSRIRSNGWPVYIIKVPFSADRAAAEGIAAGSAAGSANGAAAKVQAGPQADAPAPGSTAEAGKTRAQAQGAAAANPDEARAADTISRLSESLGSKVLTYDPEDKSETARKSLALPVAEFPAYLGKKGYSFSFPLKIRNATPGSVGLELDHVVLEGKDILQKKSFLSLAPNKSGVLDVFIAMPPETEAGAKNIALDLYFADGQRVSPSRGNISFELAPNPLSSLFKSGSLVVLFIVLLAGGLILVFLAASLIIRRAPKKAAEPVVAAVRQSAEEAAEARRAKAGAAKAQAGPSVAPPAEAQAGGQPVPARPIPAPAQAAGKPAASPAAALAPTLQAQQPKPEAAGKAIPGPALAKAAGAPTAAPSPAIAREESPAAAPAAPVSSGKKTIGGRAEKEKAAERAKPVSRPAPVRVVRPGSVQIELRVEGQNPSIGMRNVKTVGSGSALSVGGGHSDFLVFLVPVPRNAAEIAYDGEKCSFQPLQADLFPGIGPEGLEDCLGKDIVMVTRKGYRLVLRFSKYVAPKDRINRLLHCIETPGLFSED